MDPRRIEAYCALSTAASRYSDARRAAVRGGAGSPAAVAAAELLTNLSDRRVAHTLACGSPPEDVQRDGLLTPDATLRRRAARLAGGGHG